MFEESSNWRYFHSGRVIVLIFRDVVMPGWSSINYDPKIYTEPFKFDPERW